ncbi:MAG: hypothetical protein ABIQ44_11760 [Chloroflexia bacterium]
MEQDHRGIKQRYHLMRGLGNVEPASRFCSAFDEQRFYYRYRRKPGENLSLSEQWPGLCFSRDLVLYNS